MAPVESSQLNCGSNSPAKLKGGSERKLVGIDGFWYDVTDFIDKHPGGPVIERFIGEDASAAFRSIYGHEKALKYRKPVGTYKKAPKHPADEDFDKLIEIFKAKGWYETDWMWYSGNITFVMSMVLLTFVCVIAFQEWYMHYFGTVTLFLAMHQCAYLMHDFMHFQVFRDMKKDKLGGLFFGTIIAGTSSNAFLDIHHAHHLSPNTFGNDGFDGLLPYDPQFIFQCIWAQDEKLFPFFNGLLNYCLVKIQYITYMPVFILAGRFTATVVVFYLFERRWDGYVAAIVHWMWMCYLFSFLPSWWSVFIFYSLLSFLECIFHFQVNNSHFAEKMFDIEEFRSTSWYITQIETCINVDNPWWLDWFYGGMSFHIEHHLYPRLARTRLREAAVYVKEICQKHNIKYESCGFFPALWKSHRNLYESASRFKLKNE